ncbi:hypothetical protein A2Z33_02890 [Candidatus Gottesmanbacteria bacterium RBG_16_52_11]|uniref:Glycosyltransferase RgtA/B/C/D-like domain-containing protein n=1 Tax=Candidatus Gottesmanbacteria bacterium RBG_16_52_11 TaxID=1798374 RepID=A0A1F5YMK2_9BACT|nr:MAG: hypothetical protein A2Z33_02890 [Candidatus Gottesmanbacteria bacterium RBG_16_52_11]
MVIAGVFRLVKLSAVPPAVSLDEASIGYNAYSILLTGRDEYGYRLPATLRAYDDWRPALYVYLVVPAVRMIGLTASAVRLPSVILSLAVVVLTYLTGRLLWKGKGGMVIGCLAAFLVAVSPWQVYLSRLGHEANLGLFATALMVFLILRFAVRQRPADIMFIFITAAVTMFTYQSQKIITPVLLFGFAVIYFRKILDVRRGAAILVFGMAIFGVAAFFSLTPQSLTRFSGTTAFSSDHPLVREYLAGYVKAKTEGDTVGIVASHRYIAFARIFADNYLAHLAPGWLFTGTFRENHKAPYTGLIYLWEAVFIAAGAIVLIRRAGKSQELQFLLIWLLSSPLPGAVTTQAPHAMRSYTMVQPVELLAAFGIYGIWIAALKTDIKLRLVAAAGIGIYALTNISGFAVSYFRVFPYTQSDSFQAAAAPAFAFVNSRIDGYDRILVANDGQLYQSYMFYLYYSRYDPGRYLSEGGTVSGGFAQKHRIGKIEFGPLPGAPVGDGRVLYVGNTGRMPAGTTGIAEFSLADGTPAISVAQSYAKNQ